MEDFRNSSGREYEKKILMSSNRHLIFFLAKKNIYSQWMHNVLSRIKRSNRDIKDVPIDIGSEFSWDDTEQGHQFWSELYDEHVRTRGDLSREAEDVGFNNLDVLTNPNMEEVNLLEKRLQEIEQKLENQNEVIVLLAGLLEGQKPIIENKEKQDD